MVAQFGSRADAVPFALPMTELQGMQIRQYLTGGACGAAP